MATTSEKFELTPPPPIEELTEIGDPGEFFASFIELLQGNLVKHGMEAKQASHLVSQIVCELALSFKGETFYIAKKPAVFARQMAMYADLQTMPHYDVDKKYGVSRGYSLKVAKQINDKRKQREDLQQLQFNFLPTVG